MTDQHSPRYGTIDRDYAIRLATTAPDDDGPIWMVNLMSYKQVADYADGRESTISGEAADDLYTPLGPLAAIGAEVMFAAKVESQLLGDTPRWDRVGIVRYPSRRAFIEMQSRPDFKELHPHKEAGMASTIVMGCLPMPTPPLPPDAPDWADVAHPPTPEDGPVVVLHVLSFHDDETATVDESVQDMAAYTDHAALVAVPHGVRLAGWFSVEGTIVGDGRTWHQARFNAFPSKAAFMDVVFDPARLEAQRSHREVALADTYTMILRPFIDRLADSIAESAPTP